MHPFVRGPAPELLAAHAAEVGASYATQRAQNPAYRFQWPSRAGRNLGKVAREALLELTSGRCSYCDDYPLDTNKIDHFRPKGRAEFYTLVGEWNNLLIACDGCNHAKREQWDELLLRPDDPEVPFAFERYFWFLQETGKLEANPWASPHDQARAQRTIDILDLNRRTRCNDRILWWQLRRRGLDADAVASAPYRFLNA